MGERRSDWRQFIYSILRLAFSTGNGFIAVAGLLVLAIILKLSNAELVDVLKVFLTSTAFASLGWILLVVSVIVSAKLLHWRDDMHKKEIDRMALEKTKAQQQRFTQTLLTSGEEQK